MKFATFLQIVVANTTAYNQVNLVTLCRDFKVGFMAVTNQSSPEGLMRQLQFALSSACKVVCITCNRADKLVLLRCLW